MLVKQIKSTQANGFPTGRNDMRELASKKLGVKRKFNRETGLVVYPWHIRLLIDHPELSVRIAEGVSSPRARGMNQEEFSKNFNLLESILKQQALFDNPSAVSDVTGLQLSD